MISVEQALAHVLGHAVRLPPRRLPLDQCLGLQLAEQVASDIDSPPHDKSLVDGYAIVAEDLASGSASLTVLEEVTAGAVPTRPVTRGTATRIMTGAPIPAGTDAVVMVERTEFADGVVRITDKPAKPGQNLMRRATSLRRGAVVLSPPRSLRAIELGLLAEVGCVEPLVIPRPYVGVLATGNELVPPREFPGPGQIRNSNTQLLTGLAQQVGAVAIDLGVARDDEADLRNRIGRGLGADVLVLSGGVSAGVLDLVPSVLSELGVREVFHKIDLKPGKPLWFGVAELFGRTRLVFGLPGNPVSSLVCFELFVRPALEQLSGREPAGMPTAIANLTVPFDNKSERTTYHPGRCEMRDGDWFVTPLPWQGSADLRTLTDANCLTLFGAGPRRFVAGDSVEIRRL